ncbi:MAG: GCN5-related N-acetyltransferase [Micavibrio sp.]|nr:GCN5-related N-acetyltransferase [Micavibrio sp.]
MLTKMLQPSDYTEWLPLWNANMEYTASEEVTALTWSRICDPASMVGGLGIRQGEDLRLVGICHYILHPTTGNTNLVCVMQDLYVRPEVRAQGLGRALVDALVELGRAENWARLYWLAETENEAAQQLYKSLGRKLDFTVHILPLG